jgi:hypothetical protein
MTTPLQGFLEKRKVEKTVRGEPHVVEAIAPPCTTAKNCPFATGGPRWKWFGVIKGYILKGELFVGVIVTLDRDIVSTTLLFCP